MSCLVQLSIPIWNIASFQGLYDERLDSTESLNEYVRDYSAIPLQEAGPCRSRRRRAAPRTKSDTQQRIPPASGGPNKASEVARSFYRVRLAESDFSASNRDSYTTVRTETLTPQRTKLCWQMNPFPRPRQDSTRINYCTIRTYQLQQTTKTATADLLRRFPGFQSLVSASQSPGCIWIYRP